MEHTQYNIAIINPFHRLYFQVIKRAATFTLLGDVDFKRNGDVAIWCILNTTSTSSPLFRIIKICAGIFTGDTKTYKLALVIYLLSQFFQHSRSSLAHYKNQNAIMKHATRIVTIGDDINLTRILTKQDHVSSQIL